MKDDFNIVNRKIVDLEKYVCNPDGRESVTTSITQTDVETDNKEMHKPVEKNDRYEETEFVSNTCFRPEITFPQLIQLSYHTAPTPMSDNNKLEIDDRITKRAYLPGNVKHTSKQFMSQRLSHGN